MHPFKIKFIRLKNINYYNNKYTSCIKQIEGRTKAVKKQKLEYEDYRKLISDQVGMRDKKIK